MNMEHAEFEAPSLYIGVVELKEGIVLAAHFFDVVHWCM